MSVFAVVRRYPFLMMMLFVLWESGRIMAYHAQTGRILWERQVAVSRGRSPLDRIVDSKGAPSVRNGFIATATRNGTSESVGCA